MVSEHDSPDEKAEQATEALRPVHPVVEFSGLPRSNRMVGLIQGHCAVLGATIPTIERCRVSVQAQQDASGRVCRYALRIEVTAAGKRVLIERPCSPDEETSHMEALVSQAFEALHRRLESRGGEE